MTFSEIVVTPNRHNYLSQTIENKVTKSLPMSPATSSRSTLLTPKLSYFNSPSSTPPSTASSDPPATPDGYFAFRPSPQSQKDAHHIDTRASSIQRRRSSASSRRKPVPSLSLEEQLELVELTRSTYDDMAHSPSKDHDVLLHALDSMVPRNSSDILLPAFKLVRGQILSNQDKATITPLSAHIDTRQDVCMTPKLDVASSSTPASNPPLQNSWISDSLPNTPTLETPDASLSRVEWFASPVSGPPKRRDLTSTLCSTSHKGEEDIIATTATSSSPSSKCTECFAEHLHHELVSNEEGELAEEEKHRHNGRTTKKTCDAIETQVDFVEFSDEDEGDKDHKPYGELKKSLVASVSRSDSSCSIQLSEYRWMTSSVTHHMRSYTGDEDSTYHVEPSYPMSPSSSPSPSPAPSLSRSSARTYKSRIPIRKKHNPSLSTVQEISSRFSPPKSRPGTGASTTTTFGGRHDPIVEQEDRPFAAYHCFDTEVNTVAKSKAEAEAEAKDRTEIEDDILVISRQAYVDSEAISPLSSPKPQSIAGEDGHSSGSACTSPDPSISLGPQTPRDSICTISDKACVSLTLGKRVGGIAMQRANGRKITISPDLDGLATPDNVSCKTWDRVCLERDWRDGGIQQIRRACSSDLAPTIRFYPNPPFLPEQKSDTLPKRKKSWRSLASVSSSRSNPSKIFSIVLGELLEFHDARRIARNEALRTKAERKSEVRRMMASYASSMPEEVALEDAAECTVRSSSGEEIRFGDLYEGARTIVCFIRHYW